MASVSLRDGVRVGKGRNSVVHVPGRGSFAVDGDTLAFLHSLPCRGASLDLLLCAAESRLSLAKLSSYGILHVEGLDLALAPAEHRYRPEAADLIVRRGSRILASVVRSLGKFTRAAASAGVLPVGLALGLVGTVSTFIRVGPDSLLRAWYNEPLTSLGLLAAILFVRTLMHESGHFGTAEQLGARPCVGAGIYFTGPVLYVEMSEVDTLGRWKRIRADLAGLSVDGLLLCITIVLGETWRRGSLLVDVLQVELAMVYLASLNPVVKSDLNWALRDFFEARSVTAAWGRPGKLIAIARADDPSGPRAYARLTLLLYAVYLLGAGGGAFCWVLKADWKLDALQGSSLVVPALAALAPVICIYACVRVSRRSQH